MKNLQKILMDFLHRELVHMTKLLKRPCETSENGK